MRFDPISCENSNPPPRGCFDREDTVRRYDTAEAVARLCEHDVPVSPAHDFADVFDYPQVDARDMQATVTHPEHGDFGMSGIPTKFSRTPASVRDTPPDLGEHTDVVLTEYGYSEADVERLRDAAAI